MIKYLFLLVICQGAIAQTVSTYFADPMANVDDAMVFNANGDLFGSNFGGDTVYKINSSGMATPFVTGLMNPNGLALDASENLFVCEYSAQRINKYDASGMLIETYPIGGFPSGLTRSFDGTAMIFTNVSNNSVNRLEADGTINEIFQGAPLNAPVGLTYDDVGTLYVGNFTGREIYRVVGSTVELVATVPDGGASGGNSALGFIVYANGTIYGTNFGGHEIYAVNPEAVNDVELFSGGDVGNDDGPVATATFNFPNGIIFNPIQNALYVSEFSGVGNIRRIDGIPLGIENMDASTVISIAPNPTDDVLFLSWKQESFVLQSARILDATGKLIKEVSLAPPYNRLDVSELHSGLYFLTVTSEDNQSTTKLFVRK